MSQEYLLVRSKRNAAIYIGFCTASCFLRATPSLTKLGIQPFELSIKLVRPQNHKSGEEILSENHQSDVINSCFFHIRCRSFSRCIIGGFDPQKRPNTMVLPEMPK